MRYNQLRRLLTIFSLTLLLTSCQQFPQRKIDLESMHDKAFNPTVYLYDQGTALEGAERFGNDLGFSKYGQGAKRTIYVPDGNKVALNLANETRARVLECLDLLRPGDVQQIKLKWVPLVDRDLEKLGRLQGLEILNLSGSDPITFTDSQNFLTDEGIKHIAGLSKLQSLDLTDTYVDDAGVKLLAKCKMLKHLIIGGTQVSRAAIEELKKALPECKISYEPADDGRLRGLVLITQALHKTLGRPVDQARLAEFEWDADAVAAVSDKLKRLPVIADVLEEAAADKTPGPGQRALQFPRTAYLARLPVAVYDPNSPADMQVVGRTYGTVLVSAGKLVALQDLDQAGESDAIQELLSLLKPEDVNRISWHNATNDDMRFLKRFTNLRVLDISNSGVTDPGLDEIGSLTAMQALDISSTGVTGAGVHQALKGMKSLKYLQLKDVFLTRPELIEIKQALPDCEVIAELPRE